MEVGRSLGFKLVLALLACVQQSLSSPVTSVSIDVLEDPQCNSTVLHEAVKKGSAEDVDKAIESGVDMYAVDCKGMSAMHLAIELKKADMIYALVENDFDLNYLFSKGESVLFLAIRLGDVSIVTSLISLGSNVNFMTSEGSTPLLEAIIRNNEDMINLLKNNKASYEFKLANGDSCLHRASESGRVRLILKLLELKLNIDELNNKNETPLAKAVTHNHPAAINILVSRGANISLKSSKGETLLYQAVMSKSFESLRPLLANGADPNAFNEDGLFTPLFAAAKVNSRKAAEVLIKNKADLHMVYEEIDRGTLLHMAVLYDDAGSIPWIVELGLDVNSVNQEKRTPLHYAALHNKLDAAKILVKLNACRTCKDNGQKTPYDLASTAEMKNVL